MGNSVMLNGVEYAGEQIAYKDSTYELVFDAALRNTRIEMSSAERRQFYEKHIRHMMLTIDENGNVSIELKRG